jgi:nicotinic acetylcholine receptor alpha-7
MGSFTNLKIALVFASICTTVSSSRYKLRKDLLQNYDKETEPNDKGTDFTIEFYPQSMIEFNEKDEKFAMSGLLKFSWRDPKIAKNWANSPHQSSDIETMYLGESKVWTPRIVHMNAFSRADAESMYESPVQFSLGGLAFMLKKEILTSKCKVDMYDYPFDIHTCSIELAMLQNYMDTSGRTSVHKINFDYFENDTTWDIKSSNAVVAFDNFTGVLRSITFQFKLERAASYVSLIIIVPMTFMVILQPFSFCIPRKSGERVGFSTTVILSMAIYLTIFTTFIPQSSRSGTPFMIGWVFGGFLCTVVIHVLVILSLNPKLIKYCARRMQANDEVIEKIKCWTDCLYCLISACIVLEYLLLTISFASKPAKLQNAIYEPHLDEPLKLDDIHERLI